ncbi:exodeoxyribonuclease VII small subunit [Candidatus Saccharibacteria bacterium]|nr:exodeoxyribonuclease VII small subunit [Candidatus Saccharibacteria bacterium]
MKESDYQTLNQRLEEVLAKLQAPDVQVDEAVQLYAEGLTLVSELEKHLEQAKNKIEKLKSASKA